MSYEFHIYLQNEPKLQEILTGLTKLKLAVEHHPQAVPAEFFAFAQEDEVHGEPSLKVLGPSTTFPDDQPSFATNDLDKCRWLLLLSCDLHKESHEMAVRFGTEIAKSHKGVVYDPQEDHLIYPKRVGRKAESRELKLLSLQWLTSDEDFFSGRADAVIKTLLELAPEALPMRYGRCLPFSNKLVMEGPEGFVSFSKKEGTVHWRGRYPCLGGAVWRPSEFVRMKSTEIPCVAVTLDFDCSWVSASRENCDYIVRLFTELAEALDCFYAGAAVRRRVTLKDGEVLQGPDSENWSFGRASYWDGIPLVKTWLTWFGGDLKDRVTPHLDSRHISMGGSFMRLGEKPMDQDELSYSFPKLPEEMLNSETAAGLFRKSLS